MSVNIIIRSGTAYHVEFRPSKEGGLWCKFSLGTFDSYKKKTDYMNVTIFDDYICQQLQGRLHDKDVVQVSGRLDINKVEDKTYYQINAQNILLLGQDFKDVPTTEFKVGSSNQSQSERMTDNEVYSAVEEEDQVPF